MREEIYKKILNTVIIEGGSSLCTLDTMIRIEEEGDKLYECKYCAYKEVADICPKLIKKDIEDILKLR